jgi:hypothetical protein
VALAGRVLQSAVTPTGQEDALTRGTLPPSRLGLRGGALWIRMATRGGTAIITVSGLFVEPNDLAGLT